MKGILFTPPMAARTFLQVIAVFPRRLSEVGAVGAYAEGILHHQSPDGTNGYHWLPLDKLLGFGQTHITPEDAFYGLWKSIHGDSSIVNDSWVWVISFIVCDKPE